MEIQILNWLHSLHTPILDKIMQLITHLGDAGIIWIILTIVMILIPKTRKSGVIMAAALIVDVILCNVILKNLIARVRPYDVNTAVQVLVAKPKDFSFPSGHTAASFASVTALYLAGEKKLWKPALALAILIAFSRMYLYVHYPTDILGGVIFGSLSAWIGYQCSKKCSTFFKSNVRETWRVILVREADIFLSESLRILAERLSQSET